MAKNSRILSAQDVLKLVMGKHLQKLSKINYQYNSANNANVNLVSNQKF
jgi:hypothetical protein